MYVERDKADARIAAVNRNKMSDLDWPLPGLQMMHLGFVPSHPSHSLSHHRFPDKGCTHIYTRTHTRMHTHIHIYMHTHTHAPALTGGCN
jgi:hypothetical protein